MFEILVVTWTSRDGRRRVLFSRRVCEATQGVVAVGALGVICVCFLPECRSCSSCEVGLVCKMPLASTSVIVNLLDGSVGVEPVFSHCLDEVSPDA